MMRILFIDIIVAWNDTELGVIRTALKSYIFTDQGPRNATELYQIWGQDNDFLVDLISSNKTVLKPPELKASSLVKWVSLYFISHK